MKTIMLAMQFASLFAKLISSEKGKYIIDNVLDLIEDAFPEKGRTQSICSTIRLMLDVPDDDD